MENCYQTANAMMVSKVLPRTVFSLRSIAAGELDS